MVIVVNKLVFERIVSFYNNVARKYKHTYDFSLMRKNKQDAINSINRIENGLLRRTPTIQEWKGLYMANTDKWYFAYRIEGNTIFVEDARHSQNMYEAIDRIMSLIERIDNLPYNN
jgi:hypothetical protein